MCEDGYYKDATTQLCEECESTGFQSSTFTSNTFIVGYVILGLALILLVCRIKDRRVKCPLEGL